MSELKPCPWCGKQPMANEVRGVDGDKGLMIDCIYDLCRVNPHVSYIPPEAAVAAWNTRKSVEYA